MHSEERRTTPRRWFTGLAAAACVAVAVPAAAQSNPVAPPGPVDGRVTIIAKAASVGVGYTWGDGTLYYDRHQYHFSVRGVTVAAVGYARVVGHGRVYNLHRLQDFSGTFGGSTGSVTLVNGIGGQFLTNGNGVQIRIDDVTKGANLSGSADGVQLELRR